MKTRFTLVPLALLAFVQCLVAPLVSAPATLLFEDDFGQGIPGWTAVQPPGNYLDGPMRWQYEIVSQAFVENSNIYTDSATFSPSATAVMLINDTVAPGVFTYRARLIAGDDDGFGLIFGYQNPTNFFRVIFTRQNRTAAPGFPWTGWNLDQKVNNVATNLFGNSMPDFVPSFVNAANRAFDVTIEVAAGNTISLTVVDDPDALAGGPTEYKLVESQTLPASAAGKVGLMTWGQSGGTPRAFQIKNPILEPTPLTGNPSVLTNNWTSELTLRADGSTWTGSPRWYLPVGNAGPIGALVEDSDIATGNDAAGQIDFPAATLTAGNTNWTNYILKARVLPTDDDGYGLVVRYVDSRNFYRIAIRNQNSATGVRRGLSIQKSVDGIFEEVFFEATPQYLFPANVPFEISAAMVENRLQVLVRGNLNTTPTTFSYEPFDLTGATIASGKIGLFGWAINRVEFDWVRVYSIDGVPIEITSAFGPATPPAGINSYPFGTVINASVPALIEDAPGVRRRATGWTGFGAVPATGSETSVSFTIDAISSLNWNWVSEMHLVATAGAGGAIAPGGGGATGNIDQWLPENSTTNIQAVANLGFVFTGWSGSSASVDPQLNLTMARPYTLQANFAVDSDNDALPDSFEVQYFGNLSQTGAGDPDLDGKSTVAEFRAGTNPAAQETEVLANPFTSRWENVQRDPILPGVLVIRDYGSGFRGVWENSNDYREADLPGFIGADKIVNNVSFEGPRLIIRSNIWNPTWTDFTASATFSVADNDGTCVYFRYLDESNWFRVTLVYEANAATWRALQGITIQKRVNGVFSDMGNGFFLPDPADVAGYKRFKITVVATGSHYDVKVIGWNALIDPPAFEPASEVVVSFDDATAPLTGGRFGVGTWGQSGTVGGAVNGNPVDAGVLIEDVAVEVGGTEVFHEDWEQSPLPAQYPVGWTNPTGTATWQMTSHGSVTQLSDYGAPTSGTLLAPKADADSANLVSPPVDVTSYVLEAGFHPFDDDGIGFVFDYVDNDNYVRALFVSQASGDFRVPRGLTISRKSAGVWSDILLGDLTFVYTPGSPFTIRLTKSGLEYRLSAQNVDNAANGAWIFPAAATPPNPRFGLAAWNELDGHFEYLRVLNLVGSTPPVELTITSAVRNGANLDLTITKPAGASYDVLKSTTLAPNSWTPVLSAQTSATVSIPFNATAGSEFFKLQARP